MRRTPPCNFSSMCSAFSSTPHTHALSLWTLPAHVVISVCATTAAWGDRGSAGGSASSAGMLQQGCVARRSSLARALPLCAAPCCGLGGGWRPALAIAAGAAGLPPAARARRYCCAAGGSRGWPRAVRGPAAALASPLRSQNDRGRREKPTAVAPRPAPDRSHAAAAAAAGEAALALCWLRGGHAVADRDRPVL
jgi:hypothetical protein